MNFLSVRDVVSATNGKYFGVDSMLDLELKGAEMDSRLIEKDFLFIPLKGERVDGHDFINDVFSKGALISLSEKELDTTNPYILVKDTKKALRDLATWYRLSLNIPVIGITGSVGKTSTKEVVASVLNQKYSVLKTAGNYNNDIGLPLTILKIRRDNTIAVLEMGISDFNEMNVLVDMAKPNIGIITNIGVSHMENLKSREGILKEKSCIFNKMTSSDLAIVCGDEPLLKNYKPPTAKKITFGLSDENNFTAENIVSLGLEGSTFTIKINSETKEIYMPLPGKHMVINALAAIAAGSYLGLSLNEIKKGISLLKPVSGRSNIIKTKNYTLIDDAYNANPVSTKAALTTLKDALGRKIAILGDMFELGEDEKKLHYETGLFAGKENIDLVICIGDLSIETYKGAKKEGANAVHFNSIEEFLEKKNDFLSVSDTILIKASNSMHFNKIVESLS